MSDDYFFNEDLKNTNGTLEELAEDISYKSVQGEKRLLRAILQKAVDDIHDSDEKVLAEVEEWFSTPYNDEGGKAMSLQYICDYLDFDFAQTQQYAFNLITIKSYKD